MLFSFRLLLFLIRKLLNRLHKFKGNLGIFLLGKLIKLLVNCEEDILLV